MELIFHLPLKATKEDMQSFAQRKSKWIYRQLSFFEQFHPRTPSRKYVSGETHLFLGREHKLRLIQSQGWKISVSRYYISVSTPDKENKHAIASRLSYYFRAEALKIFHSRSKILKLEHSPTLGYWIELAGVSKMKAKWGIYDQASDSYILNTDLVRAPIRCIDYVILHEVIHSRHLDHGKQFYTLMDKLMPDWKEWKDRMEKLLS